MKIFVKIPLVHEQDGNDKCITGWNFTIKYQEWQHLIFEENDDTITRKLTPEDVVSMLQYN